MLQRACWLRGSKDYVCLRQQERGQLAHPQPSAFDLPHTFSDDERHLAWGLLTFYQKLQREPENTGLRGGGGFLLF